ncbi:MAG: polyprenyl synthetase family protein [Desulfitobacteriaceae bacterium]|nr:polyprenyl synthetase family protein [Desulfitobacteriaceae bacterium]
MYFKDRVELINDKLNELLPLPGLKPEVLFEAMRYSVFAGGKRLRPVLFLASIEAVGENSEGMLPFACALELIHTYSLIHDDLPAMDNDDFRRGLLTCHKKYGEAQAILAGDSLLTYAFNLMLKVRENSIVPERLLEAIDEVALGAGIRGMIVGQVVDIEAENREISLDELKYIHRYKTGALFRATLRSGAILAEAKKSQLEALTEYAEQFGLAFQITDDILDVIGDEDKLGKPIGSDVKNHKSTYPALIGLEKAKIQAEEAVERAIQSLKNFNSDADPLREMAKLIIAREN